MMDRSPDRSEAAKAARRPCTEGKQAGGLRVTPKACSSHDLTEGVQQ